MVKPSGSGKTKKKKATCWQVTSPAYCKHDPAVRHWRGRQAKKHTEGAQFCLRADAALSAARALAVCLRSRHVPAVRITPLGHECVPERPGRAVCRDVQSSFHGSADGTVTRRPCRRDYGQSIRTTSSRYVHVSRPWTSTVRDQMGAQCTALRPTGSSSHRRAVSALAGGRVAYLGIARPGVRTSLHAFRTGRRTELIYMPARGGTPKIAGRQPE